MFRALLAPIVRSTTTVCAAPGTSYASDDHLLRDRLFLIQLVVWVRDSPTAFCFDLARAFHQGDTMPSLHPRNFSDLSLVWERDRCIPGALCFCFDLARVFLQVATMPQHPRKVENQKAACIRMHCM